MASSVSRNDCVASAVRAGASEVEAQQIVDILLEQKKRLAATGNMDAAAQQLSQLWTGKVDVMQRKSLLQRRHAALNILKRQEVESFLSGVQAQGFTFMDGVEAMLVGSGKRFDGARTSISAQRRGILQSWLGPMVNELEEAVEGDALRMIREEKTFHDDVVRELQQPGSTISGDARAVAGILTRYAEQPRQRLNAVGADIGSLQGWTPQAHDPWKLLKGGVQGKEEWITFTAEQLDVERSFPDAVGDAAQLRHILGKVYDSITTGHDGHVSAAEKGQTPGPRNLASGMGEHRVLHFRDADAALAYNERYGQGNIIDGMVRHLDMAARKLALMERLGPNPQAMLESLMAAEQRRLHEATDMAPDIKQEQTAEIGRAFHKGMLRGGKVGHWLAELTGETNWAAHPTLARAMSLVRATQTLSKLGGAALSAVADPFIKASAMRVNGLSWPESLGRGLVQYTDSYTGQNRKVARQLGTFIDSVLGDMHARWDTGGDVHDSLGGLQQKLFKWSGLNWITERGKAGYALWFSQHLGEVAGKTFHQLDGPRRALLQYHGIDAARWDVMRQMVETGEDGRTFFVPGRALELKDAELEGLLPESLRSYDFHAQQVKDWRTTRRRARGEHKRIVEAAQGEARAKDREQATSFKMNDLWQWEESRALAEADLLRRFPFSAGETARFTVGGKTSVISSVEEYRSFIGDNLPEDLRKMPVFQASEISVSRVSTPQRPRIPSPEQWQRQRETELSRLRNRLQTDSMAMIADETSFAIIEPDDKTRAFMRQGTRPGTIPGEAWRTIMQFKSFPIAYLQRAIGGRRWVRGDMQKGMRYGWNRQSLGDALTRDMGGLVGYTLSAITFGYAAMTLKDIAKGRQPRDPRKMETWLAAAVQSGGAGIYGDFFLGKVNRFGNDLAGTLTGPTVSAVGQALPIVGMLIRGEGRDAGEQGIRAVLDNAPFINLWYTRAALDWALLYHVREWMSPGVLNRMERKMKTEFNQEMWLSPARNIKRGGGFRRSPQFSTPISTAPRLPAGMEGGSK